MSALSEYVQRMNDDSIDSLYCIIGMSARHEKPLADIFTTPEYHQVSSCLGKYVGNLNRCIRNAWDRGYV